MSVRASATLQRIDQLVAHGAQLTLGPAMGREIYGASQSVTPARSLKTLTGLAGLPTRRIVWMNTRTACCEPRDQERMRHAEAEELRVARELLH